MKVEIYGSEIDETLSTVELPASEVHDLVNLIKTHGFEGDDGELYVYTDAKVRNGSFIIYVEKNA